MKRRGRGGEEGRGVVKERQGYEGEGRCEWEGRRSEEERGGEVQEMWREGKVRKGGKGRWGGEHWYTRIQRKPMSSVIPCHIWHEKHPIMCFQNLTGQSIQVISKVLIPMWTCISGVKLTEVTIIFQIFSHFDFSWSNYLWPANIVPVLVELNAYWSTYIPRVKIFKLYCSFLSYHVTRLFQTWATVLYIDLKWPAMSLEENFLSLSQLNLYTSYIEVLV